jgi:hypothetical protein
MVIPIHPFLGNPVLILSVAEYTPLPSNRRLSPVSPIDAEHNYLPWVERPWRQFCGYPAIPTVKKWANSG